MLFCYSFSEKKNSHVEKVDTYAHRFMLSNNLPGVKHLLAPADIVENENRFIMAKFKALFKVVQSGLGLVISIEKNQVEPGLYR